MRVAMRSSSSDADLQDPPEQILELARSGRKAIGRLRRYAVNAKVNPGSVVDGFAVLPFDLSDHGREDPGRYRHFRLMDRKVVNVLSR